MDFCDGVPLTKLGAENQVHPHQTGKNRKNYCYIISKSMHFCDGVPLLILGSAT
jgi:hypothetical protein